MANQEKIHHVHNIVIFTLDSLYSGVGIYKYVEQFGSRVKLICSSQRYGKKYGSFFYQFLKNLRRSGWRFSVYLSYHFVFFFFMTFLFRFFDIFFNFKRTAYSLFEISRKYNIPILKTNEPNEKKFIKIIRDLKPDLIITTYFDHIIKKDLIDIPKFGIINVHTALLPDYRGPFPALWPIIKGEKKIGVTVHYINNENLDVGPIIAQRELPVIEGESVLGADCRLVREGIDLAIECVYDIENGTVRAIDQESLGRGRYFGYPLKEDIIQSKVKFSSFRDFIKQFFI